MTKFSDRFDTKYEQGAWKWVNWKTVVSGLLLAVMTPLSMGFVTKAVAISKLPSQVEENQKQLQQISPKLDELIGLMKEHLRRDMTLVGRAVIADNGSRREGVWLNEFSRAGEYLNSGSVRVTNLSYEASGRERTCVLAILGTMKHNDGEVLIEVSPSAAEMLHADAEEIAIRMEPVQKGER